jgi:hypothetical protein
MNMRSCTGYSELHKINMSCGLLVKDVIIIQYLNYYNFCLHIVLIN